MNNSCLEINEKEYCIKLNKDTFDLALVRQLITRIQSEQLFFSKKKSYFEDDDIISRTSGLAYDENFDSLSEK
ncbi:hypothetical protein [Pedobacter sp. JY14-1]|uniref:hypothetical protein n=1 Tax=Pedobacter sp. JY14-1 TaxID=3034151 RepID=UPI0023E1433E|nr:hypothetical protein [Pedobacter sp. JY14-1]